MRGIAFVAVLTLAGTAWARATFLDIPVQEAKESPYGAKLLDVPFYMHGQAHPKVARDLGVFSADRRTSGFARSDRKACHIAFVSAVVSLQERARKQGGNAVIDIRSVTRSNPLSSATEFRCVAGNMVVDVALEGRVVKLAGKR
jgi:uncharacterized protein YbjQ (UPF0145 family)